jgi:hypothetical protein
MRVLQVDEQGYEKGESVDDLVKIGTSGRKTPKLQTTDGRRSTDIADESRFGRRTYGVPG